VHKREENTEKPAPPKTKKVIVSEEQVTVVSPARDRKTDAIVQRATRGLMKRDSRRRVRSFFRRVLIVLVIGSLGYAGWYFGGHLLPLDLLKEWWADIEAKLVRVFWAEE
jgi:hypothetical protein